MVTRTKKIFVGGLSASTVQADLTSYFSTFGKVEEAMLMFDRQTNRHRGFGFVTFDTEEAVEKVCQLHYHEINNKTVRFRNNIIITLFIRFSFWLNSDFFPQMSVQNLVMPRGKNLMRTTYQSVYVAMNRTRIDFLTCQNCTFHYS